MGVRRTAITLSRNRNPRLGTPHTGHSSESEQASRIVQPLPNWSVLEYRNAKVTVLGIGRPLTVTEASDKWRRGSNPDGGTVNYVVISWHKG